MTPKTTRGLLWLAFIAPVFANGCLPDPRSRSGYDFSAATGWQRLDSERSAKLVLAGEVLEAYDTKPGIFALLKTGFIPRAKASELAVELYHLLLNLPSLEIHSKGEVTVAGLPAARIEATGVGNGQSLAPTTLGLRAKPPGNEAFVPTRRVWIKVPRGPEKGTLEILFHCPEAEYERKRAELESTIHSLRLEG